MKRNKTMFTTSDKHLVINEIVNRHGQEKPLQNTFQKTLIMTVVIGLLMTNTGVAKAEAADKKKTVSSIAGIPRSTSQDNMKDGRDFLKEMSEAANAVQSYSSTSSMTVFKGGKTISENSKFYFKKPRMIRAEELGPYKKGSVAVLLKNGKIKGHLGGILSKFTGTVDADSGFATTANDYPLVQSDFYSMSKVMLDFANGGKKTLASSSPVTVTGQAKPVYVIEMYTDGTTQQLMKRAYIDPQTLLPVEWFDYKDGKLFAHTNWKDVKVNADLDDSLFSL